MADLTPAHNNFRICSLRHFETDDTFKVGTFIRLQDAEDRDIYQGTFLIVEVARSASWTGLHPHLVIMPLGMQEVEPKLYKLFDKVKA